MVVLEPLSSVRGMSVTCELGLDLYSRIGLTKCFDKINKHKQPKSNVLRNRFHVLLQYVDSYKVFHNKHDDTNTGGKHADLNQNYSGTVVPQQISNIVFTLLDGKIDPVLDHRSEIKMQQYIDSDKVFDNVHGDADTGNKHTDLNQNYSSTVASTSKNRCFYITWVLKLILFG